VHRGTLCPSAAVACVVELPWRALQDLSPAAHLASHEASPVEHLDQHNLKALWPTNRHIMTDIHTNSNSQLTQRCIISSLSTTLVAHMTCYWLMLTILPSHPLSSFSKTKSESHLQCLHSIHPTSRPKWAQESYISFPDQVSKLHKRWLNQASLVLQYFALFAFLQFYFWSYFCSCTFVNVMQK